MRYLSRSYLRLKRRTRLRKRRRWLFPGRRFALNEAFWSGLLTLEERLLLAANPTLEGVTAAITPTVMKLRAAPTLRTTR